MDQPQRFYPLPCWDNLTRLDSCGLHAAAPQILHISSAGGEITTTDGHGITRKMDDGRKRGVQGKQMCWKCDQKTQMDDILCFGWFLSIHKLTLN